MSTRRASLLAVLVVTVATTTACFVGTADFSKEERAIESSTGLRLVADESYSIGSFVLGIARQATKDDPEAYAALSEIHGVDFAVYKVDSDAARKRVFEAFPAGPEWTPVVRAREKGESTQVLVHEKHGAINRIMVVARDHDELVLIRIDGHLDKLLARLQSGKGGDLNVIAGHSIGIQAEPAAVVREEDETE